MANNDPLSVSDIPEAKGMNVTDADGNTEEFVNVQQGTALFRDGGPYGDQADAIRDERRNAAREGREPNFDALVPDQYLAQPKSVIKNSGVGNVPSLERAIVQGDVVVGNVGSVDYSSGNLEVDNSDAQTISPSEPGDPVNSEKVAKSLDPFAGL